MDQLSNKKAPGSDEMPIELFKAVREQAIKVLTADRVNSHTVRSK